MSNLSNPKPVQAVNQNSNQASNKQPDSIISRLSKEHTPPEEYRLLLQFSRTAVAKEIGVQTNHLSSILSGWKAPSRPLHQKLMALVHQVQAEMNEVKAGADNDR